MADSALPDPLKRVRNKPGEWWASAPSPATLSAESRSSRNTTAERNVKRRKLESHEVKNGRGGVVPQKRDALSKEKRYQVAQDVGSKTTMKGDDVSGKSSGTAAARRGRSSNTEAELKAINYKETATRNNHPNVPNSSAPQPTIDSRREATRKKHNQYSKESDSQRNRHIAQSQSISASIGRRGRSSNTEAELRAVNYKEAATRDKKQSGKMMSRPAAHVPRSSDVRPHVSTSSSTTEQRQGHSSNTEAELKAVNYQETRTNSSQKRLMVDPESSLLSPAASRQPSRSIQQNHSRSTGRGMTSEATNGARKRKRSSAEEVQSASLADVTARPSVSNRGRNASQRDQVHKKDVARPANSGNVDGERGAVSQEARTKLKHQKQSREHAEQERAEQEIQPVYQYLAAVPHNISRAVIDTKWTSLPDGCAEKIAQLLEEMQKSVIARLRDPQQQSQASTALRNVSKKIVRKIGQGLPFPPNTRATREDDFDFEGILDYNRVLESQLDPVLHGNNLLEAELQKELHMLEEERKHLGTLENNAKAEATKRKQDSKAMHPYLQGNDEPSSHDAELELQSFLRRSINSSDVSLIQLIW